MKTKSINIENAPVFPYKTSEIDGDTWIKLSDAVKMDANDHERAYCSHERAYCSMEKKYTIQDFISWIEKYVDLEQKFTISQIANIIGKAMVNFFEDSETPY